MKSILIKIFLLLFFSFPFSQMVNAQGAAEDRSELTGYGAVKNHDKYLLEYKGYKEGDENKGSYKDDIKYKRARRIRNTGISFVVLGALSLITGVTVTVAQDLSLKEIVKAEAEEEDLSDSDLEMIAERKTSLNRNILIGDGLSGAGGLFLFVGAILLGVGEKRMFNVYNLYYYKNIP